MLTLDLQINWLFLCTMRKNVDQKNLRKLSLSKMEVVCFSFFDLRLTLIVMRCTHTHTHTYVKLFIESWKSPLLNFPREFRVKRAKKFVKPALHGGVVWVVQHYTYIVFSNLLRHIYQSTWGLFNINSLQDIRVCMYLYVYFCI